jgi:phage FluMu protein Com
VVELIKSCIPNIVDPWKLNNLDLDAVIVAIKAASGDGSMTIGSQCPSCNEQNEYGIDLLSILNKSVFIDYTDTLKIRELEIKFRPLTYEETNKNSLNQFKIQKTLVTIDRYEDGEEKSKLMSDTIVQLTDLVTKMVANTIEHIQTPETLVTEKDYIVEFLNNCDRDTGSLIRNKSVELREKNELEPIDIKCPECKHEYKQKIELNVTDFFD